MKYKISLIIAIVIVTSAFLIHYTLEIVNINETLCNKSKNKNEFIPLKMEIKEANNKGVTVIITDENEEKEVYSSRFILERFMNNEWEYVRTKDGNICCNSGTYYEIGDRVGEDNNGEMRYNWYSKCGVLPSGLYRLSHQYGNDDRHTMRVEFNIE